MPARHHKDDSGARLAARVQIVAEPLPNAIPESFALRLFARFHRIIDQEKVEAAARDPASNAYGLTNVPTAFWISEGGAIEISSVGWMRKEFEEMASKAAAATASVPLPIFQPKETIADFRAG